MFVQKIFLHIHLCEWVGHARCTILEGQIVEVGIIDLFGFLLKINIF